MNLHEYQAKQIFKDFSIPTPDFAVASSLEQVQEIISKKNLQEAVLKVQVLAGGRGKAGGIKLAKTPREILEAAKQLLGMKIVNTQTGPNGVVAHSLLISPIVDIRREYYMAAVIDRARGRAALILSPEGGVEIEEVAAASPEKILSLPFGLDGKVRSYNLLHMVNFMGWKGNVSLAEQGKQIAQKLAALFIKTDASLIEINPLVETAAGELTALDAKMSIDENALFRHPELAKLYDPAQLNPQEVKAKAFDLSYIALHGNIGCMVNGAGLAMATMDMIKLCGGSPANFLDVGGGASEEKVAAGFKIIVDDPHVKSILVNIFGGIMNCETLAAGIVSAVREVQSKAPIVVRMEGTNVEKGMQLLADSGVKITLAKTLTEAAQQAVALAKPQENK
jgi:succinyl-CoA synthetase beta subunit